MKEKSIAKSLDQPLVVALARGMTEGGRGGFNPASLFRNGEQGAWYDPSDLSTLFQDSAGTTPVTAVGQPVGLMRDKSGRGYHVTQATADARPTLQRDDGGFYYLLTDGANDCQTVAFTYAAYPLTIAVAAKADADQQGSPIACNNGTAAYHAIEKTTTANTWAAYDRNVSLLQATEAVGTNAQAHVLFAEFTSATINLRADSTDPTPGITNTNGFGLTASLLIGQTRPGSLFFKGRFYGGIVLGRAMSTAERTMTEAWLAARCGRIMDTALMGKTIAFLGDSITEGGDYPERVAAKLGATARKYGFGGCRMGKHNTNVDGLIYDKMCMHKLAEYISTGTYTELTQAADDLFALNGDDNRPQAAAFAAQNWAAVDYLVIFFGTNDWGGDLPLGTTSDSTSATYRGAINYVVSQIRATYPAMKIAFVGPTFRSRRLSGDGLDSDTYPNTNGEFLSAFSDAVVERGAANSCQAFDGYRSSGINAGNAGTYLVDGLHPTSPAGYQQVANAVAQFLASAY